MLFILSSTPRTLLLLSLVAAFSCDSDKPSSEPKSRVQAVVNTAATTTQASAQPSTTTSSTTKALPAPKPPRPPLCAGQLADRGTPFTPNREPVQRAASGEANLPESPVLGKGKRWTWINFWAAWCKPCKEELPVLQAWQKRLSGKLEFAYVSFDDDERQLSAFLKEQGEGGLTKTYWLPDGPERMAWLKELYLETEPELPMQLLIDPKGRLRCKVQGAIEESDFATLEKIVSAE